jgi:50S ribosomal protein L16 3-hydroxylase
MAWMFAQAPQWGMLLERPLTLLGGLSPRQFMSRHWQKRPLLVRQAWPGVKPPLELDALLALAAREGVESRLVVQSGGGTKRVSRSAARGGAGWHLQHGPFKPDALPPLDQRGWTLLVQGLDLHDDRAHQMLEPFRFVPHARLDDVMVSYATDGGGVGPHVDAYDVFLLQVQGMRRWRVGPVADARIVEGLPVRILRAFEPTQEWVLAPGDMLYLPPRWGHDGVAQGPCMTCSIGFRVPGQTEVGVELMQRLAETAADEGDSFDPAHPRPRDGLHPGGDVPGNEALYRDPRQPPTQHPGRIPEGLQRFALQALQRQLRRQAAARVALGEWLSEPKPSVWFDAELPKRNRPSRLVQQGQAEAVVLDRRTRMMYDDSCVYVNGESFQAAGRDAQAMAWLADHRRLEGRRLQGLTAGARIVLADWVSQGWVHVVRAPVARPGTR